MPWRRSRPKSPRCQVPRYISEQRRTVAGHVVVQFVDDELQRRTIGVPFELSDAETLQALMEHVNSKVPLRPERLDNDGG